MQLKILAPLAALIGLGLSQDTPSASCSHIRENAGLFFTITNIRNWDTGNAEQALRAQLGQQCGVTPGNWIWEQQPDGSAIVTFMTPPSTSVLCVADCIRWAGGPYSTFQWPKGSQ